MVKLITTEFFLRLLEAERELAQCDEQTLNEIEKNLSTGTSQDEKAFIRGSKIVVANGLKLHKIIKNVQIDSIFYNKCLIIDP